MIHKQGESQYERIWMHRILEILSWIILGLSFLVAVYGMFTLPDVIATHYNVRGEVDDYGSPATLFMNGYLPADCQSVYAFCQSQKLEYCYRSKTEGKRFTGIY